jgi:hypothetical protein
VSLKSCPLRSLRRPPNLALPPFKSFGCFFRIALLHSLSNVVVASQSMLKVPHSGQRRHNVPSANNTGRVTRSTLHQWSLPYRTTVWLYREGGGGSLPRRNLVRATQACNCCRARKQRCDEARPCQFCRENNLECQYKDVPPPKYVQTTIL